VPTSSKNVHEMFSTDQEGSSRDAIPFVLRDIRKGGEEAVSSSESYVEAVLREVSGRPTLGGLIFA